MQEKKHILRCLIYFGSCYRKCFQVQKDQKKFGSPKQERRFLCSIKYADMLNISVRGSCEPFPGSSYCDTQDCSSGTFKENALKFLVLLLNEKKSWQLNIQLASYKERLHKLRNLCYYLEDDDMDLLFKVGC